MIDFFILLIISVLISFGMSVMIVEKGDEFPIRRYKLLLKKFIHDKINYKFVRVLDCLTCCVFWNSLIGDILLFLIFGFFFWPLSGFIASAFAWVVVELLNAIDKEEQQIIVINGDKKNEE